MAIDRRKEFKDKENELMSQKQDLEAKGQELSAQNSEETEVSDVPVDTEDVQSGELQPSDRRAEFANKGQELLDMQNQLQRQSDDIARKTNAGLDANSNQTTNEPRQIVDKNRIKELTEILEKYKAGKKNLDERIKNNQEWWKLRHYGNMSPKTGTAAAKDPSQKDDGRPKSVTSWIVNSLANKHADYMDNYPEANCLPVEQSDKEFATKLSSVIPCLYERVNHEQVYSDEMWDKLIAGTSVECHTWDNSKQNGLGDISIKNCDILNLFWESGITDIQDSEYFFHTQLMSNNKIKNMFPDIPELKNLTTPTIDVTTYNYDDTVDTSDHSVVVDCYYHKVSNSGRVVLHYCKFVNDILLFASENIDEYDETGYYKHGKYPYIFDTTFPIAGSPCGFGYVDVGKEIQKDIDELNDDFMHNAKQTSRKRYVMNKAGGINEEEFSDVNNEIIHAEGAGLDEGNFKELVTNPLDGIYLNLFNNKVEELKEVMNNRDVNSGGTISGVQAASAISALQESGSKTSRDQEASSYRAFKEGVALDIELMSQFYTETRYFRVTGNNGEFDFVGISGTDIGEQVTTDENGNELSRKPMFDIKIKPQKRSQFSKQAHNELIMTLNAAGVFNPQNATQACLLVSFLEFEGKERLLGEISKNGTIYQMLQQYQQITLVMAQQLDALGDTNYTEQVQMAIQNGQVPMIGGNAQAPMVSLGNGNTSTNGNRIVDSSREEARAKSEVR